jgi:hypothetical protein
MLLAERFERKLKRFLWRCRHYWQADAADEQRSYGSYGENGGLPNPTQNRCG